MSSMLVIFTLFIKILISPSTENIMEGDLILYSVMFVASRIFKVGNYNA